jgi:hypothetical protein
LNFLGCLLVTAGPGVAVAVRLLAAVAAFTSLFYFWRLGGRGLEARHDGIRFRRGLQWHFISWPQIKAFSIKRPASSPTVYVDLVSNESRIVPFTQGRQTRWRGGKSRDTVAVLNSELAQARSRVPARDPRR